MDEYKIYSRRNEKKLLDSVNPEGGVLEAGEETDFQTFSTILISYLHIFIHDCGTMSHFYFISYKILFLKIVNILKKTNFYLFHVFSVFVRFYLGKLEFALESL